MTTASNITSTVATLAAATTALHIAEAALNAARSLSKRTKNRDVLIAATRPAYEAADAAYDVAELAVNELKHDALNRVEVDLLDAAVDAALQRATVRLNVDFHRIAGLVQVAAAFRQSVESSDFKAVRSISIGNPTGFGEFDGITVTIETGYRVAIGQFEVAFNQTFVNREGLTKVRTFSPVRVDAEGFSLTSTNLDHVSIDPHAFSKAWKAAEILADVAKGLHTPEARAARKAVEAQFEFTATSVADAAAAEAAQ